MIMLLLHASSSLPSSTEPMITTLHFALLLLLHASSSLPASSAMPPPRKPRIYVYNFSGWGHPELVHEQNLAGDIHLQRTFRDLLLPSPYVVDDPRTADYFYMDLPTSHYSHGEREIELAIEVVQKMGPWWDR